MKNIASLLQVEQPTTKASCEHQEMMGLLKDAGYAVGKWQGMWAKLLKQSGINELDLQRLLKVSLPKEYNKCGFVRNRLKNKDWVRYFD